MKSSNVKVKAVATGKGTIDFYLVFGNGEQYYLLTRAYREYIYKFFECGVPIRALKDFKPCRSTLSQKLLDTSRYIVKVCECAMKYELTA